MKLRVISALLLALAGVDAFAPVSRFGTVRPSQTARSFGLDPSSFQDISQHVDTFRDAFSSLTLADAEAAVEAAASSVSDVASDTAAAASSSNGWFGFLVGPIEGLLFLLHSAVAAVGGDANSWGVSIVLLTVLIKLLTFPLTKTQLESTNKMQVRLQWYMCFYRVSVILLSHHSYPSLYFAGSPAYNQGNSGQVPEQS